MNLYNHISKNNDDITKLIINWYSCGPTVHAANHIGHGRTFTVFDSMRKFLTSKGITVILGINITDIDDKINSKVKYIHLIDTLKSEKPDMFNEYVIKLGKQILSYDDYLCMSNLITLEELEKILDNGDVESNVRLVPPFDKYKKFLDINTETFWKTLKKINVDLPTLSLRVSDVMSEIVEFIDELIKKDYAYKSNGSVYFDTEKYSTVFCHCNLSNSVDDDLNIKDGYVGDKKNPKDFALWKKEKKNSISFPSKFGNGTPGWHIECSVISKLMFGNNIDIHSGGIDLKFPHHHNEVLQSNCYHNKHDVFKHFIYTGHVHMNGEKMAQSVGNYITIDSYLANHSANSMRLLFWMSSWDKSMEMSQDMILQAETLEKRIIEFVSTIKFQLKILYENISFQEICDHHNIILNMSEILNVFDDIDKDLENGFKTDEVIRQLNVIMTDVNKVILHIKDCTFLNNLYAKFMKILHIIGLKIENPIFDNEEKLLSIIVEIRNLVRKNKLYNISDLIRDQIIPNAGYLLQDTEQGSKIRKV